MKKKLIYISILPLDKNNYERFGIEKILNNGWDIEYWIFFGKYSSFFSEKDLFYKNRPGRGSKSGIWIRLLALRDRKKHTIQTQEIWPSSSDQDKTSGPKDL
mgnify:CR=1 FL=1